MIVYLWWFYITLVGSDIAWSIYGNKRNILFLDWVLHHFGDNIFSFFGEADKINISVSSFNITCNILDIVELFIGFAFTLFEFSGLYESVCYPFPSIDVIDDKIDSTGLFDIVDVKNDRIDFIVFDVEILIGMDELLI